MRNKPIPSENTQLRRENASLATRLKSANDQIVELQKKLKFFEEHERLAAGIRGESIIAKIVGGLLTSAHSGHDFVTETDKHLEIKFSRLTMAAATVQVMRWQWSCVFGRAGGKEYDQLILVGVTDPVHRKKYKDPGSPYILFDIPFNEVMPLTTSGGNSGLMIKLSQNPFKCSSVAKPLFDKYQVTESELRKRYNI